ncbi:regulator [Streptomyces sp. TUS-ST3]|uniref:ATP-binding protein n=1 Tax=Streptomyces sp. TUS-ST3 TaxID=3025591 RepID=UPI0024E10904|nr:regulator [Streptomyces sp. TUS-ST3]
MVPDEDSSFVGRVRELEGIRVACSIGRLVTLTGPGGVGKTRLARQALVSGRVTADDGVAWADLAPLVNPDLLAATVADALGLSDHTPRLPTEAICSWLGSRHALLVLDSCEHLLAACRGLVGDLLTACPNLRILTTTRQPLQLPTESVVRIEPPASTDDALALFADRAAAAGSPLRGDEDRRLATELCDGLERLPLALELAAAQLRSMPLADLCLAPRAAVDLPTAMERTAPLRHAALRTTIGWSHELCTPPERLLWTRLSYLPGPFNGHTARQVASGGPLSPGTVDQGLVALRDKSVLSERDGTYRMLDTVREYGRMWLAELGETEGIADRHAAHVLAETRSAHEQWFGPAQRDWYRRLSFLHSDIRLAVDRLLTTDPGAALETIGNVTFFWVCSGYLYEARQYLERAMSLLPPQEPDSVLVEGLWSLGLTRTLQGEHAAARPVVVACRRAARAAHDTEGLARTAYLDGLLLLLEGRPLAALTVVEEIGRATGSPPSRPPTAATALCRLLHVFALTACGRLEEARHEALGLRTVCTASDEYWTRSYLDHQLALIALLEGRTQEAVGHARAVLRAKRHIGDDFGIAMALDVLAIALCDRGEDRPAAHAMGAGLRYWETVGHPQRGTPEMASLRDECETRLVQRLGRKEYDHALDEAARRDARTLVTWAARGGPLPEG